MLPVLQAQEELAAADAMAYGSGHLSRTDARRWARQRRLRATAVQRDKARQRARVEAPADLTQRLAKFGITVEMIPVKAKEPPA